MCGCFLFYANPAIYIYRKEREMIYLQNTTESQVLFVPKNGTIESGELTLKARNTIDNDFIIDTMVDINTSDLYFNLAVTLPAGYPDGEYEYALMDNDIVLSTGILILESAESRRTEYNKDIEYEQYKAE